MRENWQKQNMTNQSYVKNSQTSLNKISCLKTRNLFKELFENVI